MAFGSSKYLNNKEGRANSSALSEVSSLSVKRKSNAGGLLGGIGYLGKSLAAGVAGIAEGIIDANVAPIADLMGDHDYAKYVFKDNVIGDWQQDFNEEYNPTGVMSFLGDVLSGVGQSAYFFIPYAGAPMFFQGIISQSISSAAEKTGEVGVKEAAYGFVSGAVEGALELGLGAAARGAKSIAGAAAKSTGKTAAKSIAKSAVRKGLAQEIFSSAASEFFEEAASEIIDTGLQNWFKIDPGKQINWSDVVRSGFVGMVSGGITASVVNIPKAAGNRARGAKIIKDGNSQTLVNTATNLANKLADAGTNFKKAPEWIRALRSEVDAYNKLAEKGKQNSASAQTILGEMQASVSYAQLQASYSGVLDAVMNASEDQRAAWAEYINQSYDKDVRKRDFTAEDIKNNTDEIATQLAIMRYTTIFDIEGAVAEAEIQDVIAKEQMKAGNTAGAEATRAAIPTVVQDGTAQKIAARAEAEAREFTPPANEIESGIEARAEAESSEFTPPANKIESGIEARAESGATDEVLKRDADEIEARAEIVDDDIRRIREAVKSAVADIEVDGKLFELTDKHVDNIANGIQKYMRDGMSEADAVAKAVGARLVDIKTVGESTGVRHVYKREDLQKIRGAVINAYRAKIQSGTAKDAEILAQEAQTGTEGAVAQESTKKATETKEDGKAAEKSSVTEEKSSERKKIAREERAAKEAEARIAYEKEVAPTVKELNLARELVKGFDNAPARRKASIIRMLRSAETGKVDAKIVKGIANVLAVTPNADIEIRFADIGERAGFFTRIGDRSLIVLNPGANFKDTIRGTVAHELVHYLEGTAGYREFAAFVKANAKEGRVEKIVQQYTEDLRKIYTAEEMRKAKLAEGAEVPKSIKEKVAKRMATEKFKELLDSEVTAKLVGDALNNEKFLKRYADRDKSFIRKASEWLVGRVKALRKKGESAAEVTKIVDEMSLRLTVLLQDFRVKQSGEGGTKYAFAGKKADTADLVKLANAEEMLKSGVDSETVRRETGWFKGYDGEWRFEIDDSDMEYSRHGFNPDYLRYKELELKFLEGTISDSELQELQNTPQDIKDINLHRLDQFVKHEALFAAYPELKRVRVSFDSSIKGNGEFSPETFSIKINPKADDVRKTLLHEIQHAVQHIEEFATGGSLNSNISAVEKVMNIMGLTEDQKKIATISTLSKYSENVKRPVYDKLLKLSNQNGYQTVKEYIESLNAYLYYERIAGEIEARDVANRADMTAEERKNTRPDIDREDVVFAESSDKNLTIEITENGNPVVVVRDDITKYASNDRDLVWLVKQSIGKFPYVALGKQKIKFTHDTKSEVTFSKYTKWIRSHTPSVYKDKMRLFNHPSEIVLATTNYINEGLSHPRTDNIVDFARGELLVDVLGTKYSAEVVIGFTKSGECMLHDVVAMTPTSFKYKTRDALSVISQSNEHPQKRSSLNNSIPQKSDLSTPFAKKYLGETKYDLGDVSYMEAVKRDDTEAEQAIVDEAAKRGGYDTPKLYHGTRSFGFTEFDFAKADDSISIFATTEEDVAKTYTSDDPKTAISERAEITPEQLEGSTDEELLYYLQKYVDEDFRIADVRTKSARELIVKARGDLDAFIKDNAERIDERKGNILANMSAAVEALEAAVTYDDFYNAYSAYEREVWALKWADSELMQDLRPLIVADLSRAYNAIATVLENEGVAYTDGERVIYRQQALNIIRPQLFSGVYRLYGKTGNALIIEGDGANWNELDGRDIGKRGKVSTRDVVEYALRHGYDSVIFNNIIDTGSNVADGVGESTVYAFLREGALKSADPITYDDDGNIILPSERFNPDVNDVRYDLGKDGEVKDQYFAAAVERMNNRIIESQANTIDAYKDANRRLNKEKAELIKDYKRLMSEGIKQHAFDFVEIERLRGELREAGYNLDAERRRAARFVEQNKKQIDMLDDVKQENRELKERLREAEAIIQIAQQEAARLASAYARQREEIGKVYSRSEIKKQVDEIVKSGRVFEFLEGKYLLDLPAETRNHVADYISVSLNMSGTTEGKYADELVANAARDIVRRMTVVNEEDGSKTYIDKILDKESIEAIAELVENDIADMFGTIGKMNPFTTMARRFEVIKQKYLSEKKNTRDERMRGEELTKTYQAALKMRQLDKQSKGTYSENVAWIVKQMGSLVDESGHLRESASLDVMRKISSFFQGEEMKYKSDRAFMDPDSALTEGQYIHESGLADAVDEFVRMREANPAGPLTGAEMKLLGDILRGMKRIVETHNKESINEHFVDRVEYATEEATDLLNFIANQKTFTTKVGEILGGKLGKAVNEFYFYNVISPEILLSTLEGFKKNGALQTMFRSIRVATQKSSHDWADFMDPFREFTEDKANAWEDDKHIKRKYNEKLNRKMINVDDKQITLGEAIYLLMLTKREHSHLGLIESGFKTYDKNGMNTQTVKIKDIKRTADNIYNQLDKTDVEFLKLAEHFFNDTASKYKRAADEKIFGFSNNQPGYYVPIIRDRYARGGAVTDSRQSIGSIITVYNKSFTQNLVKNNKALEGKNVLEIINDHAQGLADYSNLYLPLKTFDRIYNQMVDVDGERTSIREILNTRVWNGSQRYLSNLFKSIQGQSLGDSGLLDKMVGQMRGWWVNSVLGANIKVVATQTTSLGAATQIIEPKYITQSLWALSPTLPGMKNEKIDALRERAYKYSDIIKARVFEMGALKSQGNVEKINKIGEYSGFMIGAMDERVCLAVFHAAELKVQAAKGFAVGTVENLELAGKIADETIYTTQAMTSPAEKSALQRSKSEIAKLFSMFTSDSVKQLSHLYGNIMKYMAHRERAKTDESYKSELEKDKADLLRSVRTVAITGIMLGLITQLFTYLYGKEEEEPEDKAWDLIIDVATSTLNIMPGVSDILDKIIFDYDLSVNVLDVANDTLDALKGGFATVGKSMSGQYVSDDEKLKTSRNVILSVTSFFGVPLKPVERTVIGLLRRFTPTTVYGYDTAIYGSSYTADLKKAVDSGDETLAEYILSELYKDEVGGKYTSDELEEVARLYALTDSEGKHYNVLPQQIGESVNGVKLNAEQRKKFNSIYGKASDEVNKLIDSAYYTTLSDEQKAKAIKNIYAMYYGRAANEIAGKEMTTAVAYSYLTSNYAALFASQAYKSGLSEQIDAKGDKVTVREQFVDYAAKLGLSEVDALVVSYANGVKDKNTRAAFLEYLNSVTLNAEIKKQVAERLGFVMQNGTVTEAAS